MPAGPGAADVVPPASAPTDAPSTGSPSTGAPERVEAPVGSANGAVPAARQPATVAASAPAAPRTPEGNLASHSS